MISMVTTTNIGQTQVGLNPMQLHLISMLKFNQTEEAEKRLESALMQFYLSEFENAKEQMFASGELTEEMIEAGAKKHFRTPY